MASNKSAHKLDIRVAPAVAGEAGARRVAAALKKRDKKSTRAIDTINRQLGSIHADYQKQLSKLIGPGGIRALNEIRKGRAKRTRSQKKRAALALLRELGVDRAQIFELRRPYLRRIHDLIALGDKRPWVPPPHDEPCAGPFTTYTAPYSGTQWNFYAWRTSSRAPVLEQYLDRATGHLGSNIRTTLTEAGENDRLIVESYTGFNIWHTPQVTGPLEVRLWFEFNPSIFSGKTTDEWGWSEVTHAQYAQARMRATDSQDPNLFDDALLLINPSYSRYAEGHDELWSVPIASPYEIRSYLFRTAATFHQGSPVLLDAGIKHVTWWVSNDQSVITLGNVDLHLNRIEVRSCPSEPEFLGRNYRR